MSKREILARLYISIHALREEGDEFNEALDSLIKISIHALREEGDVYDSDTYPQEPEISIHALREEGDAWWSTSTTSALYFYPRPPRGGRQFHPTKHKDFEGISIHALREEGDLFATMSQPFLVNFYPRPPRGGRLDGMISSATRA